MSVMLQNMSDIAKLGYNLYFSRKNPDLLKYSEGTISRENAQYIFVKALCEEAARLSGIPLKYEGKLDFKLYNNPTFKYNFFNLIAENLEAIIPKVITDSFDQFSEVRNLNFGDKPIFRITSPDLFVVSKVAYGTTNVTRQRLDKRVLELNPTMRIVKIADDMYNVLSGRAEWDVWVNKVAASMVAQIKIDMYTAISNSYDATNTNFMASGSFTATTFNQIVERVRAACGGAQPVCFGTKLALAKVLPLQGWSPPNGYPGFMSPNMMDEYNNGGYLGRFMGTPLIQLDQVVKLDGSYNFAISDNFLYITCTIDKPVKIAFGGETFIFDNLNNLPQDQEYELSFQKAWDMGILSSAQYGIYQVS